jgi:hypothetical protein
MTQSGIDTGSQHIWVRADRQVRKKTTRPTDSAYNSPCTSKIAQQLAMQTNKPTRWYAAILKRADTADFADEDKRRR